MTVRGWAELNKVWVIVVCLIGDLTNSFVNTYRNSGTSLFSGDVMSSTVGYHSALCSNCFITFLNSWTDALTTRSGSSFISVFFCAY